MRQGQRPSRHWRRILTKSGVKNRFINPHILKTNRQGFIDNLDVSLTTEPITISLPEIIVKRIGEFRRGNREDNARTLLDIYQHADDTLVNVPTFDDIVSGNRERYYFILKPRGRLPIGVGAVRISNGEIQKIYILPPHRRKHYAASFVKKMETILISAGMDKAIMFVKPENEIAANVWRRLGYSYTGEYGPNNSLRFEKTLRTDYSRPQRIMSVI